MDPKQFTVVARTKTMTVGKLTESGRPFVKIGDKNVGMTATLREVVRAMISVIDAMKEDSMKGHILEMEAEVIKSGPMLPFPEGDESQPAPPSTKKTRSKK